MRLTLTLLASFTVFRHQSDHCGLSSHQLTGSNYEAPVAVQWESVGPPGRSGNRERWTGGDWRVLLLLVGLFLPLKSKQSILPCLGANQGTAEIPSRDGATVCVVLELTLTRRGGEFANIFFSPPLYTITSLRDVLPYISPSQGVSRKYFQILTPLSGDTAGVNHVNVNFHEFHIKWLLAP